MPLMSARAHAGVDGHCSIYALAWLTAPVVTRVAVPHCTTSDCPIARTAAVLRSNAATASLAQQQAGITQPHEKYRLCVSNSPQLPDCYKRDCSDPSGTVQPAGLRHQPDACWWVLVGFAEVELSMLLSQIQSLTDIEVPWVGP